MNRRFYLGTTQRRHNRVQVRSARRTRFALARAALYRHSPSVVRAARSRYLAQRRRAFIQSARGHLVGRYVPNVINRIARYIR